jgi:hypothetical protein
MTEYEIEANTRRCAVSGRELRIGERFYSVLLERDGKFQRRDYSSEAWQGPPEGAFSFWSGPITAGDQNRLPRIDEETLIDCFERLDNENEPGRVRFRYIVALLLMRRKRLKFEEISKAGDQGILCLRESRSRRLHRVIDPHMTEEEMTTVQEEVLRVLGWQSTPEEI